MDENKDTFGFDGMENTVEAENVEITDEMIEKAESEAKAVPTEETEVETEGELSDAISEEEAEVLAEEALLDGDAEDAEAQLKVDEKLAAAIENGQITSEEAEQIRDEIITELDRPAPKKNKGLLIGLCCGIGVLVIALVLSIGTILKMSGFFSSDKKSDYTGLVVGKNYSKNVELVDYKNLTYTDSYVSPTEQDVTDKIHTAMKEKHSKETDVDVVADGDTTVIDFDGYIDGEKKDNACGTDKELVIGSKTFIDGFESGLIGHKVGEKVTLNLTFPENYSAEELRGKAARFEVTIKSAKRTTYDELTDAIAAELSDNKYKTVAEYKKSVQDELVTTARQTADKNIKDQLWTQIVEKSTLKKYPQEMYDHFYNVLDTQYSQYYSYYKVDSLEDLFKAINMDLETDIKKQMLYEFSIFTIANEQKIGISDEDVQNVLKEYGYETEEALLEAEGMQKWEFEEYLLYNNVTDYLLTVAKEAK